MTFADRASELTGTVCDAKGAAASEQCIVVFSADRSFWFVNSRRIAAVKADRDGLWAVRNLPPGEYRLGAAADLEQSEWFDPTVLDRLTNGATAIRVAGVEQQTVNVVVR